MTKLSSGVVLGITLLLAMPAGAQIYKSTDEQGNVVFSDTPPAGAADSERVELPHTNTTPPPPVIAPIPRPDPGPEPEPVEASPATVSITSPANETTIPMGGGNFTVTAAANMASGQSLQLLMDGAPQGEPQQAGVWNLENVFRGSHDLVVEVRGKNGEAVASSDPVRVYVLRPSIN